MTESSCDWITARQLKSPTEGLRLSRSGIKAEGRARTTSISVFFWQRPGWKASSLVASESRLKIVPCSASSLDRIGKSAVERRLGWHRSNVEWKYVVREREVANEESRSPANFLSLLFLRRLVIQYETFQTTRRNNDPWYATRKWESLWPCLSRHLAPMNRR